jgi:hypothetical protein
MKVPAGAGAPGRSGAQAPAAKDQVRYRDGRQCAVSERAHDIT